MNGINLDQVLFVRAVFRAQPDRLKSDPPTFPDMENLTDDLRMQVEESVLRRAQAFDFYRDIKVVSTLLGDTYTHYVVPDDVTDWTLGGPFMAAAAGNPNTALVVCGSEAELLARFWHVTHDAFYVAWLAGWQLNDKALPTLINKAMQANVFVPDRFLTDVTRRFGGSDKVFNVDSIYSQGAHAGVRALPELADMLTWWGVPHTTGQPYPSDRQLLDLKQQDWLDAGCAAASKYLWGMKYLMAKYYGYTHGLPATVNPQMSGVRW